MWLWHFHWYFEPCSKMSKNLPNFKFGRLRKKKLGPPRDVRNRGPFRTWVHELPSQDHASAADLQRRPPDIGGWSFPPSLQVTTCLINRSTLATPRSRKPLNLRSLTPPLLLLAGSHPTNRTGAPGDQTRCTRGAVGGATGSFSLQVRREAVAGRRGQGSRNFDFATSCHVDSFLQSFFIN